MTILRRLIYREVLLTVGFVCLVFLGLFFFFDLIDELQWVGKGRGGGYQATHALTYVSLMVPSHIYEVLPIAVLIGTIAVMARLAQSSEFTILRTSGLGPVQALRTLSGLGLFFCAAHFCGGRLPVALGGSAGATAQSATFAADHGGTDRCLAA